jgi:hypothetical protein
VSRKGSCGGRLPDPSLYPGGAQAPITPQKFLPRAARQPPPRSPTLRPSLQGAGAEAAEPIIGCKGCPSARAARPLINPRPLAAGGAQWGHRGGGGDCSAYHHAPGQPPTLGLGVPSCARLEGATLRSRGVRGCACVRVCPACECHCGCLGGKTPCESE